MFSTPFQVVTISMESFYKELSEEDHARAERGEYDFDHPSAFDFDKFADTMNKLERGFSVTIPHYDNVTSRRIGTLTIEPADVIMVEGILVFYDDRIREKFAMKLFVDADADVRLARRVRRDTVERKKPLPLVLTQYTNLVHFSNFKELTGNIFNENLRLQVKPAFEEFCRPTMKCADVIIPRGGENDVAIDLIVQHIQVRLGVRIALKKILVEATTLKIIFKKSQKGNVIAFHY
ncbi:phosphoribulokinase/uridine kinase family protein [Ancylostoma duodenale]|uniref:uridine/cytidine kinase n=1 Tax=Ancylostoma duodenale TaxID=51022 RepID=A0A0C2CCE5_9BILA|nr:phosphoribulokinase/uridine kinase family protein [Ancylostoma duodenale]